MCGNCIGDSYYIDKFGGTTIENTIMKKKGTKHIIHLKKNKRLLITEVLICYQGSKHEFV